MLLAAAASPAADAFIFAAMAAAASAAAARRPSVSELLSQIQDVPVRTNAHAGGLPRLGLSGRSDSRSRAERHRNAAARAESPRSTPRRWPAARASLSELRVRAQLEFQPAKLACLAKPGQISSCLSKLHFDF
eukprot:s2604_g9.t1